MRFVIVMATCSVVALNTTVAQWIERAAPTSATIWRVDFIDETTGYTVFMDTVMKSVDRGNTWTTLSGIPHGAPLTGVCFLDRQIGYACRGQSTGALVVKTSDGGGTWTDISPPLGVYGFINDLVFRSNTVGWAFGDSAYRGRIVKTTDGGISWAKQNVGQISYLESGYFVDSLTGWAVGNYVILHTTDGGDHWYQQDSAFVYNFGVPLHSVHFVDCNHGCVVGGISWYTIIATTTDGGATWSNRTFTPPNPAQGVGRLSGVWFVDDTTGWVVGRVYPWVYGMIMKTTDGGASWYYQLTDAPEQFQSVCFADRNHGWAVGQGGVIYATTDGGVTFVEQNRDARPEQARLEQNYPNPFNPTTTIEYNIGGVVANVKLTVYDILGREVAILVNEKQPPGRYAVKLDGRGLASGVYVYRLESQPVDGAHAAASVARKMVLLR